MTTDSRKGFLYGGSVIFFAVTILFYWYCEKLPLNNGFGWDGSIYAKFVESFEKDILAGTIDAYYIRRVLPAILVALPSRLFHMPVTPQYVVTGFVVANICNLLISFYYWLRIASFMKLSMTRNIVGIMLLFVTLPILKLHAYTPVSTDSFALATALAMLYYYLKGSQIRLSLVIVAAYFIWIGTIYLGIFLLFFPRASKIVAASTLYHRLPRLLCPTAVVTAAILIIYSAYGKKVNLAFPGFIAPPNRILLPLSIVLALGYVYWCSRCFCSALKEGTVARLSLTGSSWLAAAQGVIVIGGCLLLQKVLAPNPGWSTSGQLKLIAWCSVKQPLLFIVSSITYYGSVIVFLLINLKKCLRAGHDLGVGALLAIVYALALGMSTEPRFYINIFPFIVLVVVLTGPFDRLSPVQWGFLAAFQLFASKFWLTIGATASDFDVNKLQSFPAQYLFMNYGTWMSDRSYLLHLGMSVAAVVLVVVLFFRGGRGKVPSEAVLPG